QQQSCHVGTSNKQYSQHGHPQHQESLPYISYDFILQTNQVNTIRTSILLIQAGDDSIHLGTSLFETDSWLQPGQRKKEMPSPTDFCGIKSGKTPRFHLFIRESKTSRHHADDRVGLIIQRDRLIYDARIATKIPRPCLIAQHYEVIAARPLIVRA